MSIPKKDECPTDVLMNEIADMLSPTFKKLGFTPNQITSLSLIFGILAVLALWKKRIIAFAVLYIISYFFDCMDGYYARKYKMTSEIGDWYDHIKDIIVGLLVFAVILIRYKCSVKMWVLISVFMLVFTILLGMFVGCHAKVYKEGNSTNFLKAFCPGKTREENIKSMQYLKYFGTGTWTMILIIIVVVIHTKCL